jgi:hypothetical protein
MPDGGALGFRLFSMVRELRTALAYLLAAFLLLGGIVITPGTVLCVGPGNHCHLETAVGASCSEEGPVSDPSTPRPRDGCPKGSRDLRLSVDTHRSDNAIGVATFTLLLTVAMGVIEPSRLSNERSHPGRSLRVHDSPHLIVILRC